MRLFRVILLFFILATPLNANTIYNLIKIPNLEIYEINTKNKLKYFYASKSFRLGVQKNIVCLNSNKEDYNNKYNLISRNTEKLMWSRHIADSAQLLRFIDTKLKVNIADLGTGAGFPGISAVHITMSFFFSASFIISACFFLKSSLTSFA